MLTQDWVVLGTALLIGVFGVAYAHIASRNLDRSEAESRRDHRSR